MLQFKNNNKNKQHRFIARGSGSCFFWGRRKYMELENFRIFVCECVFVWNYRCLLWMCFVCMYISLCCFVEGYEFLCVSLCMHVHLYIYMIGTIFFRKKKSDISMQDTVWILWLLAGHLLYFLAMRLNNSDECLW